MRALPLADATRRMTAPDDWNSSHGECETLEIYDGDDGHGNPVMVSAWTFEPGELENLRREHLSTLRFMEQVIP